MLCFLTFKVPDHEGLTVQDSGGKNKSSNIESTTGQKVVEASKSEKDDDFEVNNFLIYNLWLLS